MIYSTKDVLKILNISKPTLYKLCKQRNVNPKTVGRHYRYTEFDLRKLLVNEHISEKDLETKFVSLVNDVWLTLVEFSNFLWTDGEEKLRKIMLRNRKNIFFMNITTFKGIKK
jgi:hypothetical protein